MSEMKHVTGLEAVEIILADINKYNIIMLLSSNTTTLGIASLAAKSPHFTKLLGYLAKSRVFIPEMAIDSTEVPAPTVYRFLKRLEKMGVVHMIRTTRNPDGPPNKIYAVDGVPNEEVEAFRLRLLGSRYHLGDKK